MSWRNSLKRLVVFEIAAVLAIALAVGVAVYASMSFSESAPAPNDVPELGNPELNDDIAVDPEVLGNTQEGVVVDSRPQSDGDIDGADVLGVLESPKKLVVRAEYLSEDPEKARDNSRYLQSLIDRVSRYGGGSVVIPAGTFRFAALADYDLGSYAIEAKSHVNIVGDGQEKTILMPVGSWAETGRNEHGVDMFAYFGLEQDKYLIDADFRDFSIDGAEAKGSPAGYTASGKGFYFKLFKDCDWLNVTVRNTDGTGFGIDFPIDSTIVGCTAEGCGKNATPNDVGASGFGIGTGYSNLESLVISDCRSYNNTKFGFFFEHQTRFNPTIEALFAQGFAVVDSVASGNLYNFGGARAHDVTYLRCTSVVSKNADREAYTARAFCFENHSCRTKVVDCTVEQRYSDVWPKEEYFEAVNWALSGGILECTPSDNGQMLFNPQENMLRGEAVSLLWRYAGRPSEVAFRYVPDMPRDYADVNEGDYFIDAALWMRALGNSTNEEFRGGDPITRAELITMLWRMAGKPGENASESTERAFYADALIWALSKGLTFDDEDAFLPDALCTRAEVVMLLQLYDEKVSI